MYVCDEREGVTRVCVSVALVKYKSKRVHDKMMNIATSNVRLFVQKEA